MKNNIRVFTIVGIVASLIGYFYLLYTSYSLSEAISSMQIEVGELEDRKQKLTNEIKQLDNYNARQDSIIQSSNDVNTRIQGIELKQEMGEPISDYFVITQSQNRNLENAQKYEEEGFQYLVERNVDLAISSFKKSENSYNSYHQVFEIARYLSQNKKELSDKNSQFWIIAYKTILKDFSYKLPLQYKQKLEELVSL